MFSRRIVVESLRSQWKATCRTSLSKKAVGFNGAIPSNAGTSDGVRWISKTSPRLSDPVLVSQTKADAGAKNDAPKKEKEVVEACGDVDDEDDEDDMEQEEMFVEAHESFEHKMAEWGGPRRGGRLPEPTRFGDWERKGRCTDF